MAKKSKKSKRAKAKKKGKAPRATFDRPAAKVTSQRQAAVAAAPKRGEKVDFREEYRYVLKDLKRLGILAAVMLAVLLALAALIA